MWRSWADFASMYCGFGVERVAAYQIGLVCQYTILTTVVVAVTDATDIDSDCYVEIMSLHTLDHIFLPFSLTFV